MLDKVRLRRKVSSVRVKSGYENSHCTTYHVDLLYYHHMCVLKKIHVCHAKKGQIRICVHFSYNSK